MLRRSWYYVLMTREQLYTVAEVSQYLQLSRQQIYRLIDSGELRAYRMGRGSFRIPESALDEFLVPTEADD